MSLATYRTDCSIGAPGIDIKTQCGLLSVQFGFQHLSLDEVLRGKSNDQTYLHAKFVKDCIQEEVEVPIQLAIGLLETKINGGIKGEKRWSFVRGFPENIEQLVEFKKKVSITHLSVALLTS